MNNVMDDRRGGFETRPYNETHRHCGLDPQSSADIIPNNKVKALWATMCV
ncbi:hypothetical protein FACS1894201_02210 [Bacteroidia bacterium]|nr:hypothetical protein FACS1894201_02210 [Bacteroidia bacterium]